MNQVRELQQQGLDETQIARALEQPVEAVRRWMIRDELAGIIPNDLTHEAVGTLAAIMRGREDNPRLALQAADRLLTHKLASIKLQTDSAPTFNLVVFNQEIQQANERVASFIDKARQAKAQTINVNTESFIDQITKS